MAIIIFGAELKRLLDVQSALEFMPDPMMALLI